jgi:hypothetical protein
MTRASDVALYYLTLAGYVFHQGGFKNAWEHFSGQFLKICEEAAKSLTKGKE